LTANKGVRDALFVQRFSQL